MKFSVSGNLASMACGLPYANAAALAYPDRPIVALVGDGGLSMLMAELATAAKYDLNVKIAVLKNNSLGQIKWEQMAFLGNPEYGCDLQPIDYAGVAQACGIRGYAIVDPEKCSAVLTEAFSQRGPALIEATIDANEPPLPPKVSFLFEPGTIPGPLSRIPMRAAPMTSGPRVNTQSPTGAPQRSAMSMGHPNYKHIDDAIYAAAEQLRDRPRERRKIIFLISDGQNAKNNTHSYKDTLKLLLSADISVYAVGVGEANLNRGVTFLGNNVLAKYAHSTGGDIFYGSSREDLEGLYPRVSEQARNQYTLAYSAAKTDRTQPYHSIEVRVERPGLSMLARDGYYLNAMP